MSNGNGSEAPMLVERAKAIILHPLEEWNRIAKEDTPSGDIFTAYILPLALIAPLSGFIGGQLFGYFRYGLLTGAIVAVLMLFLSLISLLAIVTITDFLSAKFGGETNYFNSFKLVAYASTPAWITGIFAIVPSLGVFSLLALYSIYLFYVGTGPMLNIPKNRALAFTLVICGCAVLLNLLIGAMSIANVQLLSNMGLITPADIPVKMHGMPSGE